MISQGTTLTSSQSHRDTTLMSTAQELFEVADAADEARNRLGSQEIQTPLQAIRTVASEATRAWSGSNIGYHAIVYFAGLQPAPADAQFSIEWGAHPPAPSRMANNGFPSGNRRITFARRSPRFGCD